MQADRIRDELIQKSLEDPRLRPLLSLLSVGQPDPYLSSSERSYPSEADAAPSHGIKQYTTRPFSQLAVGEEARLPLSGWEVEEVLGAETFRNWTSTVEYR